MDTPMDPAANLQDKTSASSLPEAAPKSSEGPALSDTKRAPIMRQFELIEAVKAYDPTADEALLNRAYVYAMKMHGSQLRASGDPYFAHPIQVAGILTDYRLDTATIVTALLHDVVEDTSATRDDIADMFGEEIAVLVEGVTKLSRLELQAEHTRQAENLRKFILAISRDVRVLLVKLADRLHNMRTLHFVKPEKRERISRETLEVYAPLGRSIGIHSIAAELEELAFEHLNATARVAIQRRLEALKLENGSAIEAVSPEIERVLAEAGVQARVKGREKTPYSIWRKLQRKTVGFSSLSDIYGFRVIVESEDDCYRALGVIHRAWPMVPERFKDFISTPKSNNYRSLHTTVVGPGGLRIEMQIRTEAMDRVAEDGVAAHWRYKNQSYGFDREAMEADGGRDPLLNLRHLVQVIEHGEGGEDWVEHAKLEMYLDQVFVFTPKGTLITLPRGGMPLDFAYAVHTEVGDTAVGVKINGELKPMRTALQNGDVVEIIRGTKREVPTDWRSLTVTGPGPLGHPPPYPHVGARRVRASGQDDAGADAGAGGQVAGRGQADGGAEDLRHAVRGGHVRRHRSWTSERDPRGRNPVPGVEGAVEGRAGAQAHRRGIATPVRARRRTDARRQHPFRPVLFAGAGRPHRRHP